MEPGIQEASWSPDDSLLALVTGKLNKMVLPLVLMEIH